MNQNLIKRKNLAMKAEVIANDSGLKNKLGFTLVEFLVGVLIFSAVVIALMATLNTSQGIWTATDSKIVLQNSLRAVKAKISKELGTSGIDSAGNLKVSIVKNAGLNHSDQVVFSIPILCHEGDSLLNLTSNVAYWGSAKTWGCTTSSCMDADNDCSTKDYAFTRYEIGEIIDPIRGNINVLYRQVLDNSGHIVFEEELARHISGFTVAVSADQSNVTIQLTASVMSFGHRNFTLNDTFVVYLRNKG